MTTARNTRRVFKSLVMNPVSINRVEFYNPGYLVVNDGQIEDLTDVDPRPGIGNAEFHDLSAFAILPGFVDTHVHLPQFAIMGIGSASLLDWLKDYTYPEETRFSDPEYARLISENFFDALVANGTTCACVYSSVHETATDIAFELASRKGIRAFIGKTMMDRNAPAGLLETTESSIRASLNLCSKWNGAADGRIRYVFSPRFAGSCSMDLMRETARIAEKQQVFIQSHLSENKDEVQWIRSLFPNRPSYSDVYASAGLLGERTIMAHCIHLSDAEISMLAASRTKVAFCPYSNRTLHSGTMSYQKLQSAGLHIGLGTDIAGGPSLSMFRQMGEALHSANATVDCLSPSGALYLATLGGAQVLGLGDRIGNFERGKDADFIVADYNKADPLSGTGPYNEPMHILSRLCCNGDSSCVRNVFTCGRLILNCTSG